MHYVYSASPAPPPAETCLRFCTAIPLIEVEPPARNIKVSGDTQQQKRFAFVLPYVLSACLRACWRTASTYSCGTHCPDGSFTRCAAASGTLELRVLPFFSDMFAFYKGCQPCAWVGAELESNHMMATMGATSSPSAAPLERVQACVQRNRSAS
jgi:hypothetical protein